jgi:UDP-GlcNAc:undecaprenyl-phosphate/decaprenyl-phosphate GlcNAc-1-phosphate transferase
MTDGSVTSLIAAFACALASSLVLTPLAGAAARALKIVDCPDGKRKLQSRPIALLGGVAVLFALGLGIAAAANFELPGTPLQRISVVASFCFLCAAGACDDVWSLRARWKLLAQFIAALPLAIGVANVQSAELLGVHCELGPLGPVFSLLWMVAAVNAINLIDGMDGLASTTGICAAVSISLLAWFTGHVACAPLAMALAGALLGFLYFNRPPASIYLGDAGSMIIGLTLAALSIRSATLPTGEVRIAPLLLVLGLPLADTSLAILRRWLSGRGISEPDRLHVHHRLLDAGFPVLQILALVAGISLTFGALAVSSVALNSDWIAIVGVSAAASFVLRLRLIGHYEWHELQRWLGQRGSHADPAIASDGLTPGLRLFHQADTAATAPTVEEERRAA